MSQLSLPLRLSLAYSGACLCVPVRPLPGAGLGVGECSLHPTRPLKPKFKRFRTDTCFLQLFCLLNSLGYFIYSFIISCCLLSFLVLLRKLKSEFSSFSVVSSRMLFQVIHDITRNRRARNFFTWRKNSRENGKKFS